jgi:hypothetical protein
MTATNSTEAKQSMKGGVAAGAIGGVAIAVFLLLMALIQGVNGWTVFKMASAPFYGDVATQPGFDLGPVLLGTLSHFAVSIGWGILFGLLAYGLSRPMTMLAGAGWGILVWLGMYYVVLPLVGLGEMARETPIGTAIVSHLVYGLAVGVGFLPFQQRKYITRPVERRPRGHAPVHG